jgi:uncharacterized protein (TIGR04442 family)
MRFHGNGGVFGEYMFGGHLPVRDLLNDEVKNRLLLFGATTDPKTHELKFNYVFFSENENSYPEWFRRPAPADTTTLPPRHRSRGSA